MDVVGPSASLASNDIRPVPAANGLPIPPAVVNVQHVSRLNPVNNGSVCHLPIPVKSPRSSNDPTPHIPPESAEVTGQPTHNAPPSRDRSSSKKGFLSFISRRHRR